MHWHFIILMGDLHEWFADYIATSHKLRSSQYPNLCPKSCPKSCPNSSNITYALIKCCRNIMCEPHE